MSDNSSSLRMVCIKAELMKTLIFTAQFCVGAAELLGAELAVDLNKQGIHADILSLYKKTFETSEEASLRFVERGVPHIHFLNLDPNPSIFKILTAIIRLVVIIHREGYEIVETSSLTPSVIASWACKITRCQHVCGIHHVYTNSQDNSARHVIFLKSLLSSPGTRYYAVSEFVKDSWISYSGVSLKRITTVHNSIAVKQEGTSKTRSDTRKALGIAETAKIILCVGRVARYKRQDLVVEALATFCLADDIFILFVGAIDESVFGSREMFSRIKEDINKQGLATNIRFLGIRSDVHLLMSAADLLLHSTNKEAFGLALVEALAVGLPVVSTNVESIPEILCGAESILFNPNDAEGLRRAVFESLSRNPASVTRAQLAGKKRASEFSQSIRTSKMIGLFKDALSK